MTHLYSIVCRDVDGSKPIRMEKLADHLKHIKSVGERIKVAAPLRDEQEQEFAGSLLVITALDSDDARAFVETDPYFAAGVWRDITIDKLGTAAGDWVGGIPW
ncbi:MAG: YciI family protein [Betaproteobacteria bacterium]|jgi:uncharacterized protein YciI